MLKNLVNVIVVNAFHACRVYGKKCGKCGNLNNFSQFCTYKRVHNIIANEKELYVGLVQRLNKLS